MEATNRVAIARFVMRTKQYLAAIRAKGGALVLSTMLYADEVTSADQLELPDAEKVTPSEREVKMAEQLIDSLTTEFDPARYKDEHREKVLALIEAKSEGQEVVTAATPDEPAKVVDLMAALEASLAAAKQSRSDAKAGAGEEPASEQAAQSKSA
jgi:DNA end-binding protein Ku